MADCMEFPETFEEFAEQYKIVDKHEVYTNGTALIPIFRVEQWLEHTQTETAKKIFAEIEAEIAKCFKECFKWEGNTTERREMLNFNARIKMSLGELKKKYTEGGKEQDG